MSYTQTKKEEKKSSKPEEMGLPNSSFMQSATYDSSSYSLTISFKNGNDIIHKFVYPMVWQQFKESPSKGSFYSRQIKGKYPAINFQTGLKVSDFNRAIKEHRPNADINKTRHR